ncbi:MAG: ABC transporter substrate-binding protein [Pseudomonadota bacterium]
MLVGREKDTRLLVVYGHARLINYSPDLKLFADILVRYEIEEGRKFTFHLREGHKWSDGQPFTTEDFRFFWEDVALNEKLRPTGPPVQMLVNGELPKVDIIDEKTLSYEWPEPNPFFVDSLAAASPIFIYAPAHYLKPFHEKYADADQLSIKVEEDDARDWAQLFGRRGAMNRAENPDLPTLQPWMLETRPPSDRFIARRNRYFHRVDADGQQLPYIDNFVLQVVDDKLIPIKTGAGETDLQSRGLFFSDYTFLKEAEPRSGLETRLWGEARGAHLALYPNLNANDDVWRDLFRNKKFRQALSIGLDRNAINQFLYFGLAIPSNNTVLENSPFYTTSIGSACLSDDIAEANSLLDEIGLTERGENGLRLLPDGRQAEFVVETAGEASEQVDLLELVSESWSKLGIKIHTRPSEREVLRNRIFSGEALMSIWYGIENGVPTPDMPPKEFVPTSQYDQPQWPKWGQYYETKGKAGEAPDEPAAIELLELFEEWKNATQEQQRRTAWEHILELYAAQCYTIGTVANVMQPVAVRRGLMNVPEEAVYNWEPHAQFGVYRPDTFWFSE